MNKIKVGIIGASGYTGSELLRLLLLHPQAEIAFAYSRTHAGKPVTSVFPDLLGLCQLDFTDQPTLNPDVVFLCVAHGETQGILEKFPFDAKVKIIDLSRDNRYAPNSSYVYGLPELNREKIRTAQYIANPGCFATAVQLGLLPLAQHKLLPRHIHVHAITGSTGAGMSLSETSHFSNRHSNVSVYNVFEHPHVSEIQSGLNQMSAASELLFIPQRGPFTRGIMASISMVLDHDKPVFPLFESYYSDHPFTYTTEQSVSLKQVVNTNKCLLNIIQKKDKVSIITFIDNLMKGASGQAVQNMNLMFGLNEVTGLQLKPNIY